jgi:hypothetical protein
MLQAFTGMSKSRKGAKQSLSHLHRKIRTTKPTKQIADKNEKMKKVIDKETELVYESASFKVMN